jgi:hypothetical protein
VALVLAYPAPVSSASAAVSRCSWASQVGAGGVAGYDGDLNAAYWVTSFLATAGAGLTIDGAFPSARYMSVSAYNTYGAASGVHFYDAEIQPAAGLNPFQPAVGVGAAGTYQLQIVAAPAPAEPAPNTLYVGQNNALVYVLYRVYDADSAADPSGGVGLPAVSTTFRGQVTATYDACVGSASLAPAPVGGAAGATALEGGRAPVTGAGEFTGAMLPSPSPPAWAIVHPTTLANADASYLEAQVVPAPGRIVVVQARIPTFPDTNGGERPWAPADVRYSSLCDEAQYSQQVSACVADHAAVQSGGVATFVFSAPADQPTNATSANGVNWLPWGTASTELLVYRQILADPTFAQSIAAVPPGAAPPTTMGPYEPTIAYCSPAQFESAGAAGCQSSGSDDDGSIAATPVSGTNPAPVCRSVTAKPDRLWPANHKFVLVTLSGATERGGGTLTYEVTGVHQGEPVVGPDKTEPDAKRGPADNTVRLRAERKQHGDGRLYFIAFKVTDRRGASCTRTVTVAAPRRRGQRRVRDTGARYRSFATPAIRRHGRRG